MDEFFICSTSRKGYAFVRYDNKEPKCKAIVSLNLTEIGGQVVKRRDYVSQVKFIIKQK